MSDVTVMSVEGKRQLAAAIKCMDAGERYEIIVLRKNDPPYVMRFHYITEHQLEQRRKHILSHLRKTKAEDWR